MQQLFTMLDFLFLCISSWLLISWTANAQEIGDVEIVHSWITVDFTWDSEADRQDAIDDGTYIVDNCLVSGLKTFRDDIYLVTPRFRPGVPSALNKVVLVDDVPLLQPCPNWEMQEPDNCEAFQFTQSMEIDPRTGLMWVIDTGRRDTLTSNPINACPAKLVIIDLNTDEVLDRFEFPDDVVSREENYINDIVIDPDAGFAYMSDSGFGSTGHFGGIIVFDNNTRTARRLEDDSMLPEEGADAMEIGGETYQFNFPVNGIALSPDKSQLHYSAIAGYNLYQLPTAIAQQPNITDISPFVRTVGSKISQSDGMVMGVNSLYYGALSGVFDSSFVVWPYQEEMVEQGVELDEVVMTRFDVQYQNFTTLEWPDAWTIDNDGWVYVVSTRANKFITETMDFSGDAGNNFNVVRIFLDEESYI